MNANGHITVKQATEQTGISAKKIRAYARKHFEKNTAKGWFFTEDQIAELKKHFNVTKSEAELAADTIEELTGKRPNHRKLTDNEAEVMNHLATKGWYAEPGFSDTTADDLASALKKPTKSVRGYLSSLIKKGYIWVSEEDSGIPPLVYPQLKNPEFGEGEQNAQVTYNYDTDTYEYEV